MWIASLTGFYSVTAAPRGRTQIRARARRDLVRLKALGGIRARIIHTPAADYAWRMIVMPKTWVRAATLLAGSANSYTNFKKAVGSVDAPRAVTYAKAWEAFTGIEREEGRGWPTAR